MQTRQHIHYIKTRIQDNVVREDEGLYKQF